MSPRPFRKPLGFPCPVPLWVLLPPLLAALTIALVLACSGLFRLEPPEARPLAHLEQVAARFLRVVPVAAPTLPCGEGPSEPDRDWSRLAPEFGRSVLALFSRMEERGFGLVLLEGYRSHARQALLLARKVTRAQAGRSLHQFGLAVDVGLVRDGELVASATEPWAREAYRALGEEARALGLVWGGTWAERDLCHVQASRALPLNGQNGGQSAPDTTPTVFPWERS